MFIIQLLGMLIRLLLQQLMGDVGAPRSAFYDACA